LTFKPKQSQAAPSGFREMRGQNKKSRHLPAAAL